MSDTELFELCKEVYERTGWDESGEWWCYEWDDNDYKTGEKSIETDSWIWYTSNSDKKIHPAYTSDYLLEKLPREIRNQTIEVVAYGDHWEAAYSEARDALWDTAIKSHAADTPLLSLLKLTIALSEAGELNE